jgi:hypothetical protein
MRTALNQKKQKKIISYVIAHEDYSYLIYDSIKTYLDLNPKLTKQILIDMETRKLLKRVFNNKYRENKNDSDKKKILQKIYLKVM